VAKTTVTLARANALITIVALAGCSGRQSCAAGNHSAAGTLSSAVSTSSSRPGAPHLKQSLAFGGPLPGAPPLDGDLADKLAAKWQIREAGYAPRTRHLRDDGSPKYTNRLFLQSSPYLLQHAHNPVNWYPWGDEAFEQAAKLHRPVFLSIGYSTCHWCHVMEEECFEDEDIARYLNENFVAIKVDREERPDVDAIYMQAVQTLTGGGGWPMSAWLTPDRKPFYGGTYYPAATFSTLLQKLSELYRDNPERVVGSADELTAEIRRALESTDSTGEIPAESVLGSAVAAYASHFDSMNGGTNRAPKFPSSLPIRLLLRQYRRSASAEPLKMATLTLEKMSAGGLHDQVGGGFHRYSTDTRWLVPHFEKMLYDNALLATDYLAGYQVTGRSEFAAVARDILRYVERDMTSPDGAFYAATDADSSAPNGRREEGRFFTWTPGEFAAVLGDERARIADAYFDVTAPGNFEGRSILSTPRPVSDVAALLALPPERVYSALEGARDLLYVARAKRAAPARDEKILTAWNGLMISAYAQGALVLGDVEYARKAEQAAGFVLTKLRRDGRLFRSFKDGSATNAAISMITLS